MQSWNIPDGTLKSFSYKKYVLELHVYVIVLTGVVLITEQGVR